MKSTLLTLFASALLLVSNPWLKAAEKKEVKAQLQELVGEVKAKLKEGKQSEKDLVAELKKFDELLAEHKGEKTDDVAEVLLMKAMLYVQVFEDSAKGTALLKELKEKFPETEPGKNVDQILAGIAAQAESEAIRKKLEVGSAFPEFEAKDLKGEPVSLAKFKGKVLLIDFWATWCGPCVAELPHVLETYEKYHKTGFEILGISLDRQEEALRSFIEKKSMSWSHVFDQEGELATKYGVSSIPTTYLINGEGKIAAKNLRGSALSEEVAKLVKK